MTLSVRIKIERAKWRGVEAKCRATSTLYKPNNITNA